MLTRELMQYRICWRIVLNKRKYERLLVGMVLSVLALCLSSCSANELASGVRGYFSELYDAVQSDFRELELRDFYTAPPSVDIAFHLEPAETDGTVTGIDSMMICYPHRETISEEILDQPTPTARGYVSTARLIGMDMAHAAALLSEAGVEYSVKEERTSFAAGQVFAVEYAGIPSGGQHYINPNLPVILYVSGEKPLFPEATEENTVYLTFDDGPGGEGTIQLLDILDCYGIKATFFLLGDGVKKDPDGAMEIYKRGHDVACHSMSHAYTSIYSSAAALVRETDQWVELMEGLGVDFTTMPKMFRYPGGSVSQYLTAKKRKAMNEALLDRGFLVYDWSVVVNDGLLFQCPAGTSRYAYIIDNFLQTYKAAKKEGEPIIILLHDNIPETRVVLPWIIEYLIEDGCTFAPLSERETQWTFADRKDKK